MTEALAEANYWWMIPAVAVWFASAWLRSLRWHYILRHMEVISANTLYPIVIVGYMANNLLPLRTGELVRAYIIGERHRLSKMSTLGTVAMERLFDGLVLVALLVLVGAFVGLDEDLRILSIAMSVAFVVALAVFVALASERRAQGLVSVLVRAVPEPFRERAEDWANAFLRGFGSLQSAWVTAAVVATTAAAWMLEAFMYYLVGLSFDIGEGYPVYLMVAAAANLAITLPSSAGGIGPFEFFAKETLVFTGVSSSVAAAYAAALHAVLLFPVILAGLFFLWAINLSLGQALGQPTREAMPVGEQAE